MGAGNDRVITEAAANAPGISEASFTRLHDGNLREVPEQLGISGSRRARSPQACWIRLLCEQHRRASPTSVLRRVRDLRVVLLLPNLRPRERGRAGPLRLAVLDHLG